MALVDVAELVVALCVASSLKYIWGLGRSRPVASPMVVYSARAIACLWF